MFGLYIHGKEKINRTKQKKHVDVVRDKSPGRLDDGSCSCQELSARRRSSSKSRGQFPSYLKKISDKVVHQSGSLRGKLISLG